MIFAVEVNRLSVQRRFIADFNAGLRGVGVVGKNAGVANAFQARVEYVSSAL